MYDLAVKEGLLYTDSSFQRKNMYISGGIIELIDAADHPAKKTIDAAAKKVIPGIIDPHVHLELNIGKYTSADTFRSGSIAGIYGGVTSFIDFLDPVTRAADIALAFSRRYELASKSYADFSFHVTAANPVGETEAITREALRLKSPSIKIFTAYSESNRRTYQSQIVELLEHTKNYGTVLLVHAEDEDHITVDPSFTTHDLAKNRPVLSETSMITRLAQLVRESKGRMYIVHTTCGESVEIVSDSFADIHNSRLFLESCPQYFCFDDSHFADEDAYAYICAPPLRPKEQSERLKKQIDSVYSIGTDHCPFMKEEKKKERLADVPFGIGGIEYSFDVMHALFGERIIDKMTLHPAKLFNLYPKKGVLREGSDGDFFIYNEEERHISERHSLCDYNLYENFPVRGKVETTVIRGNIVLENGKVSQHSGQFIPREAHA